MGCDDMYGYDPSSLDLEADTHELLRRIEELEQRVRRLELEKTRAYEGC